jgi:integrase/recombinase XerD
MARRIQPYAAGTHGLPGRLRVVGGPERSAAISSLVAEFLADLETHDRSAATIAAYDSDLRSLADVGSLEDFDLANVRTFLQSYSGTHKPRSTMRRLSCYRQFARFLCEKGHLKRNPLEFLRLTGWRRRQEESSSDTTGLDNREVNQLLQECDRRTLLGKRDYAILMLMLGTGARVGDAVNLNLDAVEMSPKRCRVVFRNRKGGRFSKYGLAGAYRQALEEYLAHRSGFEVRTSGRAPRRRGPQSGQVATATPNAPVFLSRQGNRMSRQTIFARVKELVRSSRIPMERKQKISPHSLRHTYVTRLWEQEKDVALVAQAAGHASPTVTLNVYTHIARERTEAAIARLQEENP